MGCRSVCGPRIIHGHAVVVGPAVHHHRDKLAAVVGLDAQRQIALVTQAFHHCHHIFSFEVLIHFDDQALLGEVVHDGQGPEAASVEQGVSNKVHAPNLIGTGQYRALQEVCRSLAFVSTFAPQVEVPLAVQPIHALVIGFPAFPAQQHEDPPETIANPHRSDLLDPLKQWRIIIVLRLVVERRPALLDDSAGSTNPNAIPVDQMAHERLALRGPQNFFDSKSCNITLSRLRSATSCLSLRFSSSS